MVGLGIILALVVLAILIIGAIAMGIKEDQNK